MTQTQRRGAVIVCALQSSVTLRKWTFRDGANTGPGLILSLRYLLKPQQDPKSHGYLS